METTMPVESQDFESTEAWFNNNQASIRDAACFILFQNKINEPDFPTMSSHVLRRKIGATATFLERLCSASMNKEVNNYWSKFINKCASDGILLTRQMGNELHVTLSQQSLANYTYLQNLKDNNSLASINLVLSSAMRYYFSGCLIGHLTLDDLEPNEADATLKSIQNIDHYLDESQKEGLEAAMELVRLNQSNIKNNSEEILFDSALKMFPKLQ
jgi:hypothetical protein